MIENPLDVISKISPLKDVVFVGIVVSNQDPLELERIKVFIPEVFNDSYTVETLPWVAPMVNSLYKGKNIGSFDVPDVNTYVNVVFENGSIYSGRYSGSSNHSANKITLASTNYPNRYGRIDSANNFFYVDKQSGDVEFFHHSGAVVHIKDNGQVDISTPADMNVQIAGTVNLSVSGDVNASVEGNVSMTSNSNVSIHAEGNASLTARGNTQVSSPGPISITGSTINLN